MVNRLGLFFGVMVTALGVFSSHAQEASNPYIYYFSDKLNAFIIEHADGTDTRVLGAGVMELDTEHSDIRVKGPGWSPSGEWFAWTASWAGQQGHLGGLYDRPYIISADGTQRLTLLDDVDHAQLIWAANEDVLFVISRKIASSDPAAPGGPYVISTYFAVVDVAQNTLLASLVEQAQVDNLFYQQEIDPLIVRTLDGTQVIVSYGHYEGNSYDGAAMLVILDSAGTITQSRFDDFGPIETETTRLELPLISPAGWIAYVAEDGFRAENVLTDDHYVFAALNNPYQIVWDNGGQSALLTGDKHLWWLDCETGQLTLLRENWAWAWPFDAEASGIERPVWSPDDRYALLLGADNTLYAFDSTVGTLYVLSIEVGDHLWGAMWYWRDGAHPVIYDVDEPGLFIFDLTTLALAQHITVDIHPEWTAPRVSSDGRYVAFVDDGAVIYDTTSDSYLKLRPDYKSFNTGGGLEVAWHETDEWLLIFENAVVAGSGGPYHLGITRFDGTQQRDLTFGWMPTAITLNWLPPQVDLASLPPPVDLLPVPQPAQVLMSEHRSSYADWSPDGRWIAAGESGSRADEITVWEVATGEIVHVFQEPARDSEVVWPAPGEGFVPETAQLARVTSEGKTGIFARSPDRSQVVQMTENCRGTQVVETATGQVLAGDAEGMGGYCWDAEYSPDGRWLAVFTPYSRPVRIWDTATWELVIELPHPGQALAWSPDGTQLAVAVSWEVQIWDVADLLAFAQP